MIWGMTGRDAQALIPTIYLLREKYRLNVKVRSVFDYCSIELLKPRVLLTNGCNGSHQTYLVTKYATERGLHTVSLHAEGAFLREDLTTYVLGRNEDQKPTVKKWFLWNENALKWTREGFPQFQDVIDVSGSTLHEKYSIFRSTDFNREQYTEGKYCSVFAYIGWGFDLTEGQFRSGTVSCDPAPEREYVTKLLTSAVRQNPEVLFILKNHPGALDRSRTEIADHFASFDNVRVISNEISIFELIFISDLAISYDSTTVLDSWLTGKPTITLCRGDRPLYSNNGYGYKDLREASLVPPDEQAFLGYLNQFKRSGYIEGMEEKRTLRQKCLRSYIGDPTRRPSEIVASYIAGSLGKTHKPTRKLDLKLFAKGLLNRLVYTVTFLPPIRGYSKMRVHFRPEAFQDEYKQFSPKLQRYFALN